MSEVVGAGAAPASRVVIETAEGITVYPARWDGDRWRAVWYEDGRRRQCQAASEAKLAAGLEKMCIRDSLPQVSPVAGRGSSGIR